MEKLVVTCKMIRNHFHDGDILFSCQGHNAFDLDAIMYKLFDFYNPDEYDDYFTFIYNGEKLNTGIYLNNPPAKEGENKRKS